MTGYYYSKEHYPELGEIEIWYSTSPIFKCLKCGRRYNYRSWHSIPDGEEIIDDNNKITRIRHYKITKANVKRHDVLCNAGKECDGHIEFVGWPVWVIDKSKEEIEDCGIFSMVKESGQIEHFYTKTVKAREKKFDELLEKYRIEVELDG